MSDRSVNHDRLFDLMGAICDEDASQSELNELSSIAKVDGVACHQYLGYCRMHSTLRLELQANRATEAVFEQIGIEPNDARSSEGDDTDKAKMPVFPAPTFLPTVLNGPLSYLSSGWPVAYLIATVIFGIGALVGTFTYVSHSVQVADRLPLGTNDRVMPESQMEFVGRITGMVDCQWADESTAAFNGAHVPLGRKYALSSGLMEINYDTGAKVILQGPVTYEVESKNSGYMSFGKLTAKVEKKMASGQWPVASKSEISNPQSPTPDPLFTVRTPTAIVTDLGTEFGVEVDKQGQTISHVFSGIVRLQLLGSDSEKQGDGITLHENESARTESRDRDVGCNLCRISFDPHGFVRRIDKTPKVLDLLDIVAGGDGRGRRRECGIDPTTGMEDPYFLAVAEYRKDDRVGGKPSYKTVTWHRFIDGVFVPDGHIGRVQINSVGDTFAGFPQTNGMVYGSIWARAATFKADGRENNGRKWWIYTVRPSSRYMPDNLGLLGLFPNAGITFNLEAMGVAYQGVRPARFRATVAVADARHVITNRPDIEQLADIWVLVDGQLRWSRTQLRPRDGVITVDIELGPKDKFLTLASTDGGDGTSLDWVVFGDPILEMVLIEEK